MWNVRVFSLAINGSNTYHYGSMDFLLKIAEKAIQNGASGFTLKVVSL